MNDDDKELIKFNVDGYSKEHIRMLDTMWSKKTIEEYQEWLNGLTTKELEMALQLSTILLMEIIERDKMSDISVAKNYLKKFTLKGTQ
jgi:hypothetical protein